MLRTLRPNTPTTCNKTLLPHPFPIPDTWSSLPRSFVYGDARGIHPPITMLVVVVCCRMPSMEMLGEPGHAHLLNRFVEKGVFRAFCRLSYRTRPLARGRTDRPSACPYGASTRLRSNNRGLVVSGTHLLRCGQFVGDQSAMTRRESGAPTRHIPLPLTHDGRDPTHRTRSRRSCVLGDGRVISGAAG